jgi:NADPH-dependent curcumin reductase CurA
MAAGGRETRQVFLKERPQGALEPAHFGLRRAALADPAPGEITVETEFVSVDPYMRGHIAGVYSHLAPLSPGQTMFAGAVGRVIASRSPDFAEGDIAEGYFGWQTHATVPASEARSVPDSGLPTSTALGVLGMPGMTAYFGMTEIGRPRPGETVVVSAASGAVGSAAGQIARIPGCRTVGIAGSDEKVAHLTRDLGFDAGINYRTAPDLHAALRAACPDRIDVYFDNVGGATFDAVTRWMNLGCRYVVCGQIAQYEDGGADIGPRNLKLFEIARARLEGLRVLDYRPRYDEGIAAMRGWIEAGRLHFRETVVEGLENAPAALIRLLHGDKIGKLVVRVR